MPALTRRAARIFRSLALIAGAALVAACQPGVGTAPSVNTRQAVPVALLLPYGAADTRTQTLAQSLENAARMAAGDLQGVSVELRVYDTAGQADAASDAARRAVADGAKVIVGPLFAEAANAAGRAVAASGVNVLSFSNNTDVAGGNVFVLGSTFENTANRVVSYAARQGRSRMVIVHDPGLQGEKGRAAFENAAFAAGATITGYGSYELSQQGVVDAIPDITETIRSTEANAVLFTADTAGALPLVTQLLADNRINPETYKYVGLTRWDVPNSALSLRSLQGGWFATPDPAASARFNARYEASFGEPPHALAGLSYDGIAAIGALLQSGRPDALSAGSLAQPSGFAGVYGVFRLRPDGTNERALAIAEIQNNEVTILDPAPRSFGAAGF
jgi:ABC-type branched-subunit amino acid transport system substrate-binding protein